MLIKLIKVK